jgi:hypothetical protein
MYSEDGQRKMARRPVKMTMMALLQERKADAHQKVNTRQTKTVRAPG